MEKSSRQIAQALMDADVLSLTFDEPVTFKSGIQAPVYLDNRKIPSRPQAWQTIITGMKNMVEAMTLDFDVIAGIETAGIPHGAALAFVMQKPFVFVRKSAKGHGLKRRVEGGNVTALKVLLIEDQISTGGSSLSGVEALREEGAIVEDCLSITSYGFAESVRNFNEAGVKLHVLASFPMIVEYAAKAGVISAKEMTVITDWLRDPQGWQASVSDEESNSDES